MFTAAKFSAKGLQFLNLGGCCTIQHPIGNLGMAARHQRCASTHLPFTFAHDVGYNKSFPGTESLHDISPGQKVSRIMGVSQSSILPISAVILTAASFFKTSTYAFHKGLIQHFPEAKLSGIASVAGFLSPL